MKLVEEFIGNRESIRKKITPAIAFNKLIIQGKEIPLPKSARVRIEYSDESGEQVLKIKASW